MKEIEKMIKAVDCCANYHCGNCPYAQEDPYQCLIIMLNDVLKVLRDFQKNNEGKD